MWEDRNTFSLSGDSESTNADIATNIRAQFNPADGCCSATAKKMSAGSIYGAEKRLKLTGNVLCRAIGRRPMYNLKVKPEQVRCAQSCAPFFPVCTHRRFSPISSSSQTIVNAIHREEDFLLFCPFPKLGESGFPNFTLSPSF